MDSVQIGDRVALTYKGVLENGEVFATGEASEPLEFQVGAGAVPPGLEKAVLGMTVGEHKEVTLLPKDAYGGRRLDLILTLERKTFGDRIKLEKGMVLGLTMERDGQPQQVPALVTEVLEQTVMVDFNHPLAGKTLTYSFVLHRHMPALASACNCSTGPEACGPGCNCSPTSAAPAKGKKKGGRKK